MAKVYGIDLGTTYSAIATLDENGMPEVIENFADSMPIFASAVYFPEGEAPVIGEAAKNQIDIESDRLIQFVKRKIGKSDSQVFEFDGVTYDPITISSLILKRMVEAAAEQGHDVKDVVITCPAYFGIEERNATKQAGIIAGLNVLNIVNEPTAAAFNYLSRSFKESKKIMVYDLGGGTFDITLFDFSVEEDGRTSIDVIRSGGDDQLGGADWDARMFNYIADEYINDVGINSDDFDDDRHLKQKLRKVTETTKMSLTGMKTKSFTVSHDDDTHRMEVSREKFEEITRDLVDRTMDYVHELLSKANVSPDEIDFVLLVGGSTKMPMIKEAVESVFPGKWQAQDPDLAVAKGAALAAAIEFNERIRDFIAREEGSDTGGDVSESRFEDGIDKLFSEEDTPKTVQEAQDLIIDVPTPFAAGSTIIDRLARSFGPAVRDISTNNLVVDNLIYVQDKSPSETTTSYKIPEVYAERTDTSSVDVAIYENVLERGEGQIILRDANGNEVYTDESKLLKEIGKVIIEIPPYTSGDAIIEFTIRSRTDGLDVVARNPVSGQIFEAFIESPHTKTPEELAEDIAHIGALSTRGDY